MCTVKIETYIVSWNLKVDQLGPSTVWKTLDSKKLKKLHNCKKTISSLTMEPKYVDEQQTLNTRLVALTQHCQMKWQFITPACLRQSVDGNELRSSAIRDQKEDRL